MASPALVTPIAPPAPGPAALITPIASQAPTTPPAPGPAAAAGCVPGGEVLNIHIDGMDQTKFAAPKAPGPAAPSTPIHEMCTQLARELILKYQLEALPEPPGNSGGSAASGSAHPPSTPPEAVAPPNNCATADDYPGSLRPLISM